jgi:pyruvate/2-oxoglutarate dehydrogenase complex dihydrolipoamide acyltransferase (E2) component
MNPLETLVAARRRIIDSLDRQKCAPTVVIDIDCDAGKILDAVESLNSPLPAGAPRVTLLHAVMKAAAVALSGHPLFNCAYDGRYRLVPAERIDVCAPVAVDLPHHEGESPLTAEAFVVVPGTGSLTLPEIAAEFQKRLETERAALLSSESRLPWHAGLPILNAAAGAAERLADRMCSYFGSWEERWMRGEQARYGTFKVLDLTAEGVTAYHGQLAKPFLAEMAMLAIRNDVVVKDGRPVEKRTLPMVLAFDHKLTDSGPASRLLADTRLLLESPEKLA